MSRGFKVGSAGLLMILLAAVFMVTRDAGEPESGKTSIAENVSAPADKAATGGPAPSALHFTMYIVTYRVNGISFTYPGYTIVDHARPLDDAELKAVRQQDETFLDKGVYHLVKIENSGPMRLHWTGYADGNAQVLLNYWDNERFIQRDIRDARENATYTIDIDRPLQEEFVYILLNCTSGQLFTDAVRIEITGDDLQDGP